MRPVWPLVVSGAIVGSSCPGTDGVDRPGPGPNTASISAACSGKRTAYSAGGGFVAGSTAELALDAEQFLQERDPPRLSDLGQVILDPRPWSLLPGSLEAVGGGVYPGPVRCRSLAHASPPGAVSLPRRRRTATCCGYAPFAVGDGLAPSPVSINGPAPEPTDRVPIFSLGTEQSHPAVFPDGTSCPRTHYNTVVSGQLANSPQILASGPFNQPGELHVPDHDRN